MAEGKSGHAFAPNTICTGKYDFNGTAVHDLPFKKGDVLIIIKVSKDPNWYKARRADGLEGMVPFNYITERSTNTVNSRAPRRKSSKHSEKVHGSASSGISHNGGGSSGASLQPLEASQSKSSSSLNRDSSAVMQTREAVKFRTMPWFHGNITRQHSEQLLTPHKDGKFLVRESQAFAHQRNLTLCVSYLGKVEHYRIIRDDKDYVSADGEEFFENLIQLVEHYQKDPDGLCCRLKYICEKEGSHDIVVSLEDFKSKGWAIPRSDLVLSKQIGKGEFGEVWQGEFKGQKVAIKMLKEIKSMQATQQFLAEASIMTTLRHENLVSLIGVSLDSQPIYLITELMAKGSLEEYLRTRGRSVISKQNLLDFAKHVCRGMVYLESQNYVHRDLAARNVLIAEDGTAKVSDFGLAREGVTRGDGQKLPVKWTAPEALKEHKFSNKSDVWSFGILLWEIYSYGRVPYPRVPVNDIMQHVEKGYRMDCPDGCPDSIYQIMRECWDAEPNNRPNFTRIMKSLDSVPFPT